MLTLYFVRHGETDYSRDNRFCGSIDPPLNEKGIAMAEAIGERYGSFGFRAIYASPLKRTIATAAPTVRRSGLELQIAAGLREIAYGEWEGRPEADVEHAEPERFRAWAEHPGRVSPPGGETGVQICTRAMAVIDQIREARLDGPVLIVSHKATLRVLICALLGIDVDLFRARIGQPPGAISVIEWKRSGPLLHRLGDVSHLPPALHTTGT